MFVLEQMILCFVKVATHFPFEFVVLKFCRDSNRK